MVVAATSQELRSPDEARRRADRLLDKRNDRVAQSQQLARRFDELNAYLGIADPVTAALEPANELAVHRVGPLEAAALIDERNAQRVK